MIDDPLNRTKVKRGEELPWAKLCDDDIKLIRQIVEDREELRRKASLLTNKKLAEKFNVHVRTIDAVTSGFAWGHV